jgi:hypothetical protein
MRTKILHSSLLLPYQKYPPSRWVRTRSKIPCRF